MYPCSAALRNHLAASESFLATPWPFISTTPKLCCAFAYPCSAALRNHL
eukprot:CAMPEP_0171638100 /NCGR_PEP_ID=MMETSP0990-20121206/28693_1 /TAXON_ID=483369 /ORGANISM="non described non described, Strain CCMP2098" /LENGTH=48 /DNA_ID= /DNA_START= /DNA_END= /DNA_ORIENTATION=